MTENRPAPIRQAAEGTKPSARKADLGIRLHAERDRLARALAGETYEKDSIGEGMGNGDSASELEIREVEYSHRSAMRQRLRQVDGALDRLRGGQYGLCAECGKRITRRRLTNDPATLLCAPCQETHEGGLHPATL